MSEPYTPDPGDHLLAVARAARSYIAELKNQLREKDEMIRKFKWSVCESEVLRDPNLKGAARDILTEIANVQIR